MPADTPMLERVVRLEEHLKEQDRKLDLIIALTEAQDDKIKGLTDKVGKMAPTVEHVAAVVTTARVVGSIGRTSLWVAAAILPAAYWLSDKWHIIGQLFRRAP